MNTLDKIIEVLKEWAMPIAYRKQAAQAILSVINEGAEPVIKACKLFT